MPIPQAIMQGVRRYTIPASNAFGLPYPCGYGNPPAACQGNTPETPLGEMEEDNVFGNQERK